MDSYRTEDLHGVLRNCRDFRTITGREFEWEPSDLGSRYYTRLLPNFRFGILLFEDPKDRKKRGWVPYLHMNDAGIFGRSDTYTRLDGEMLYPQPVHALKAGVDELLEAGIEIRIKERPW